MNLLHHRVDVKDGSRCGRHVVVGGRFFAVISKRTTGVLLEIGLNLSLELVDCAEAGYAGAAGALGLLLLLSLFVLDNLFPVGTGKEHEVKLVFVFTAVV